MRPTRLLRPTTVVRAHCDIPCGIYDPAEALLAAKTVARMVDAAGMACIPHSAHRDDPAGCLDQAFCQLDLLPNLLRIARFLLSDSVRHTLAGEGAEPGYLHHLAHGGHEVDHDVLFFL